MTTTLKTYDYRAMIQAKLDTVEKFQYFLTENMEGINKDNFKEKFEELSIKFHKSIEDEYEEAVKKYTESKSKCTTTSRHLRPPTSYNIFIKDTMTKLKIENPDMRNVELMQAAANSWNEYKKTLQN